MWWTPISGSRCTRAIALALVTPTMSMKKFVLGPGRDDLNQIQETTRNVLRSFVMYKHIKKQLPLNHYEGFKWDRFTHIPRGPGISSPVISRHKNNLEKYIPSSLGKYQESAHLLIEGFLMVPTANSNLMDQLNGQQPDGPDNLPFKEIEKHIKASPDC